MSKMMIATQLILAAMGGNSLLVSNRYPKITCPFIVPARGKSQAISNPFLQDCEVSDETDPGLPFYEFLPLIPCRLRKLCLTGGLKVTRSCLFLS